MEIKKYIAILENKIKNLIIRLLSIWSFRPAPDKITQLPEEIAIERIRAGEAVKEVFEDYKWDTSKLLAMQHTRKLLKKWEECLSPYNFDSYAATILRKIYKQLQEALTKDGVINSKYNIKPLK